MFNCLRAVTDIVIIFRLGIVLIQICEYMSNDLTLMDINFTLRHSSGPSTSTMGKERAHPSPEPQNTPPVEYHGSNL